MPAHCLHVTHYSFGVSVLCTWSIISIV